MFFIFREEAGLAYSRCRLHAAGTIHFEGPSGATPGRGRPLLCFQATELRGERRARTEGSFPQLTYFLKSLCVPCVHPSLRPGPRDSSREAELLEETDRALAGTDSDSESEPPQLVSESRRG